MTSPASTTTRYLLALGVSAGTVLFLVLGIGALGIVGDGDHDTVYLAAPAVGLLVALVTRFRARGMVLARRRRAHHRPRRRLVGRAHRHRPRVGVARRRGDADRHVRRPLRVRGVAVPPHPRVGPIHMGRAGTVAATRSMGTTR